jgi:transcriptional regulator with XRE-family HTH domain
MHLNGVTQDDIAEELGVTKSYVCAILHSRRKPPDIKNKVQDALERIIERRTNDV